MRLDTTLIEQQLKNYYGLDKIECKTLNTLANYAIEVTSPNGHFALKIYNPASRTAAEVQWEIDLTLHLIKYNVPVAKPVMGKDSQYLQTFTIGNQNLTVVLFEWALGNKPKPELSTYNLIGEAAAHIHNAADTFTSKYPREEYDIHKLIDDQLKRMQEPLKEFGQWNTVLDISNRMRKIMLDANLDYGIIHNDLTLDNVHLYKGKVTVFDLDSAAKSWRAAEPWGVLKASEDRFKAWLVGYRANRDFNTDNENAVPAFVIIEDIRNTVWKLGLAKSSRGKPLIKPSNLPQIVNEWLKWEKDRITY